MADAPTVQRIVVAGMTCDHCVGAVSDELRQVPTVTDVRVDLSTGVVVIEATAPVADEVLAAAVDEAGYEIVDGAP